MELDDLRAVRVYLEGDIDTVSPLLRSEGFTTHYGRDREDVSLRLGNNPLPFMCWGTIDHRARSVLDLSPHKERIAVLGLEPRSFLFETNPVFTRNYGHTLIRSLGRVNIPHYAVGYLQEPAQEMPNSAENFRFLYGRTHDGRESHRMEHLGIR